ncbi:MAG: YceI family protein [Saprospiraceae bacterium]|nr:YceI family protein [Saprospiraceae bacterium]
MKKFLFLPLLAILTMAAAPNFNNVDLASSTIVWKAYKVTGEHTGYVKMKSGKLDYSGGKLTGGEFVIDMNSIKCTDLEGEYAGKLEGHLKSDDFFGVATYPTAKYVITKAIPTDSKGNYKIVGNLTIKETTKEVKFNANVTESGNTVKATGNLKIDRSEYNVKYGSGSFFDGLGDKTIYDEFDLAVTLVSKK